MQTPAPLRLILLGFGNVARAFIPLLASRSNWLTREYGVLPIISGIGTRRQGYFVHTSGIDAISLARFSDPLQYFSSTLQPVEDAFAFIERGKNVGASILIELTSLHPQDGQPALNHVRSALQSGLDVITANKGPTAYAQDELQALSRQTHTQFRFESTVMDGLPLVNLAQYTLPAVDIYSFRALLNSTTNLVLSLIEQGHNLTEAIEMAQQLGIAEADPSYDLNGWDATLKTTILANTLLGGHITPQQITCEGIRDLPPETIRTAAQAGTPIRLLSYAVRKDGHVTAQVTPRPLPSNDILQRGTGTTGVISLDTEAMGTISLIEHAPTLLQTAYGIFSDLVTIVRHRNTETQNGI
jgi:homoserine dehydrogenase